jgi:hypothetical protein
MDTAKFTNAKTVHVYVSVGSEQYGSSAELKVTAFSRQDVVFNPGEVRFGSVNVGEGAEKKIDVEYAGGLAKQWKVSDIVTNDAPVTASFEEWYRRGDKVGYHITLKLKKDAPVGLLRQQIYMQTNEKTNSLVPLFFEATVQAALEASSTEFQLANGRVGVEVEQKVVLRAAKPFTVTKVAGADDELIVAGDLSKQTPAKVQVVAFKCKPAKAGAFKKQFTIQTTAQEKAMTVKVEGNVQ